MSKERYDELLSLIRAYQETGNPRFLAKAQALLKIAS